MFDQACLYIDQLSFTLVGRNYLGESKSKEINKKIIIKILLLSYILISN